MRTRASAVITSIGVVVAVALGVFASASFATEGLVTQQSDLLTDEVQPMPSLKTRGGVKAVTHKGVDGYRLSFTATFTAPQDAASARVLADGGLPQLTMRQSISFPTLSGDQEFVGPVRLPFASETLGLDVVMNPTKGEVDGETNGECFEPFGKDGYRMRGFKQGCTLAFLSLGDEQFDVTDLFIDVDSRVQMVGRDGTTWMWRTTATFEDPGYAFPIVSLGRGGSTEVVIGDMYGSADVGKVSFGGTG